MSTTQFIKLANSLSTELITEVSQDDVTLLNEILEEYKDPGISGFLFSLGADEMFKADKASCLLSILKTRETPATPLEISNTLVINGFLLLVFVTKNNVFKSKLIDYLKSLGISRVNFVLDRYSSQQ